MFHRVRREVLFARLFAYAGGHVFNNEELTIMFQCVSYLGIYHCFFHPGFPFKSLSDPKINPEIGIRLIQSDDFDKRPVRIAALNMQWPAGYRES